MALRLTTGMAAMTVTLVACGEIGPIVSQSEGEEIARSCVSETGAPGGYSLLPGQISPTPDNRYPRARAIETLGGTKSGADSINACIRQKLNAFQSVAEPAPAPAPAATPAPAPVQTELPETLPQSTRSPSAACPPGYRGLYRGTLFCRG